ncbi:MFS transporter [Actibacterium sp. 188UL27-1]|uniref:MFS transporter n=1 Tax=Actibacterium sp. 188UL27-1 TaxID=2786961 RepID=UPI00195F1723|nr:MFS transporter [Actibacterium sp. 188UL27-1]MBM7067239.1 MFS transporter [Actibacterium sp. 188UL27-1]
MLSFMRGNARWLAAGVLLTFSSSYGQTFFISVFATQIRAEFGLSDGAWGLIYTAGTAASAVVMIWAGALTDRFRVRDLTMAILPLLACACALMMFVSAIWALPVVIFALRLMGQGMTSQIATVAMARWYDKNRGKALSIATLGFSIGEAVLPLVFVMLMLVFDWQTLWGLAGLMALAAAPAIWVLLREERTPLAAADQQSSTGMGARHWSRNEVFRHWLFWTMVPTIMGISAFVTAFFFQQTHLAQIKGWQHLELVALFPLYTLTAVLTMLGSGLAIDRFGTAPMMALFQVPLALCFLVLAASDTLTGAAIGLVLMGVTTGGNATLPSAFWAEFFGTRHVGAIKAMAAAVMVLGSAIGPGLSGVLIDAGVDFSQQMYGLAFYFLVASVTIGLGVRRAAPALARTT